MTLHRRDFVKSVGSLAALAGLRTLPGASVISLPGKATSNKHVICLIMRGGFDSLSCVVPHDTVFPTYVSRRPAIHYKTTVDNGNGQALPLLPANPMDPLEWSLHPRLTELQGRWLAGELAVVHRVGYPNPNRSHFTSIDIWGSMKRDKGNQEQGWIGRLGNAGQLVNPTGAIGMGTGTILDYRHPNYDALVMKSVDLFDIAASTLDPAERTQAMKNLENAVNAPVGSAQEAWNSTAKSAFLLADDVQNDVMGYPAQDPYGYVLDYQNNPSGTVFSQSVRDIARMIHANCNPSAQRVYDSKIYCALYGGWDTHQNQVFDLDRQWGTVNQTLAALRADLEAQQAWQDTVVMLFSEFGRRIDQNGSNPPGTDHGAANVMAVCGPAVNGREHVDANQPLTDAHLQSPAFELDKVIDFRQVFYEVLLRHVGMPHSVLDAQLRDDDPNLPMTDWWIPAQMGQPGYLGIL